MHTHYDYYYLLLKLNNIILSCVLCLTPFVSAIAQDADLRIANEYFLKGEREKALAMYQALSKNGENIQAIHSNYLSLMLDMARYKDAEDYVERVIRKVDDRISYRVDSFQPENTKVWPPRAPL